MIRIACDGRTITQTFASTTFSRALDPGEAGHACQAVVGWPGSSPDQFVTWAVTNPIYLRAADPPAAAAPTPTRRCDRKRSRRRRTRGASSTRPTPRRGSSRPRAAVAAGDPPPVRLAYTLAPGARASQYAALVTSDVGVLSWAAWLRLRLSADRPMRVSIQLREPLGGQAARRWYRSLVIGPEVSTHVVPVTDFLPIDDASGPPPVTRVRSVLVVVDTTNTPPGQSGTVTVHEIRARERSNFQLRLTRVASRGVGSSVRQSPVRP